MQLTKIKKLLLIGVILVLLGGLSALLLLMYERSVSTSNGIISQWLGDPDSYPELVSEGGVACPDAPFILPSSGFIGLLWADPSGPSSGFIGLLWADPSGPYNIFHRHSGIDIFGNGEAGTIPVLAAYDGYLTRLEGWTSTVAIQHDDPLQEGRIIWTYYTHMANVEGTESFIVDDYPPGTTAVPIKQGTLIGYQGEYAGTLSSIALHLHFSVVLAEEDGSFKNESVLENTLDPSPYLGMNVDLTNGATHPVGCYSGS